MQKKPIKQIVEVDLLESLSNRTLCRNNDDRLGRKRFKLKNETIERVYDRE